MTSMTATTAAVTMAGLRRRVRRWVGGDITDMAAPDAGELGRSVRALSRTVHHSIETRKNVNHEYSHQGIDTESALRRGGARNVHIGASFNPCLFACRRKATSRAVAPLSVAPDRPSFTGVHRTRK